jgi:peptidoglycan hydrolase CwlO-like protein
MTDIERHKRALDELRNEINKLIHRIDGLEKIINEARTKNMELQGKVATLAGRIENRR